MMLKNWVACITLLFIFNNATAAIQYGIIANSHSTALLDELRKTEVNAIHDALHEPVQFQLFHSNAEVFNNLKNHPRDLTLLYAKQNTITQLQQLGNWKKIAQLLEFDPDANALLNTYCAYVITGKKSNIKQLTDLANKKIAFFNKESTSNYEAIKQLLDEKKITPIQWIQAKDLDQVLSMVATGKADAAGVWGYYFTHSKEKDKFKVLYKIKGLENPALYGNTSNLSTDDIKRIQEALKRESAKKHLAFSYN